MNCLISISNNSTVDRRSRWNEGLSSGSVLCCSFVASRPRTGRVSAGWSLFVTPSPWTGGHGGTKVNPVEVCCVVRLWPPVHELGV